jgi:hypothetical protein
MKPPVLGWVIVRSYAIAAIGIYPPSPKGYGVVLVASFAIKTCGATANKNLQKEMKENNKRCLKINYFKG